MRKLILLAGVGIGYVLGTKAGRARYEQLKSKARQAWEDPRVQAKAAEAQDLIEQNAPKAAAKAQQAASDLAAKVSGAAHKEEDEAGASAADVTAYPAEPAPSDGPRP